MTLYLIAGAVVLFFLSRRSAGAGPSSTSGISNGQTYAQDPSVAASMGSQISTSGTPFGAPPVVPGNIPVLPAPSSGFPIFQSVSAQASASFAGSLAPTIESRTGLSHFVNTTPTVLGRTGRGAF